MISLLIALMFRLSDPVLKRISRADDLITWRVTFLPFILDDGRPLPFEVLAVSEYVGRELAHGRLKLKPAADPTRKITYHDACKLARHGGVVAEPRDALRALGTDYRETTPTAEPNWCCGGGAGAFLINRADPAPQGLGDQARAAGREWGGYGRGVLRQLSPQFHGGC